MTDELLLTDGQRLLRRILECPEDDAPRLIYSDWLEEQGEEERARFIRSQVFLSRNDKSVTCYKPEDCYYLNKCHYDCGVIERDTLCEPHWKIVNDLFDKRKCDWLGESWAILYLDSEREDADGQYDRLSKAFVGRGFISSVSLTCEAFVGGECKYCNGTGHPSKGGYQMLAFCGICGGTGRIEGVARELSQGHPITEVRLVDRKPYTTPSGTIVWLRYIPPVDSYIPKELHKHMEQWSWFDTEADANAAISRACVAYGRNLVGLPPLVGRQ